MIKVGDYVTIRKNLVPERQYGFILLSVEMSVYRGETYIVTNISKNGNFLLAGTGYWWSKEMLIKKQELKYIVGAPLRRNLLVIEERMKNDTRIHE